VNDDIDEGNGSDDDDGDAAALAVHMRADGGGGDRRAAAAANADGASLGIRCVRGCVVTHVLDRDGKVSVCNIM
jgi:hypothetical protein